HLLTRPLRALALLSAPEPLRSVVEHPTTFDPTVIASRLRQMGDQCNMDFERVSSEFAAAVDSLSRRWSDQNPELAYEKAFLSVAVKLVMHVTEKVPALLRPNQLIEVINGNSRVRNYIEACGGWVRMRRWWGCLRHSVSLRAKINKCLLLLLFYLCFS
uniref:BCL2 like 15 n=1 Tax=Bubo bubo TaxID=30461 RepID=A0A8C0FAJ2_BUBBB